MATLCVNDLETSYFVHRTVHEEHCRYYFLVRVIFPSELGKSLKFISEIKVPILFREEEYPQDLRSRCHLYIGIGHYLKSTDVETREARQSFAESALHHLQIRYWIKGSVREK